MALTTRNSGALSGRARLLAMTALAALAVPLLGTASAAQAETQAATYEFDIPAQALSRSINQVASRANVQVLYSGDGSRDLEAPALKGRLTVDEGLARLLAGSGYSYRYSQPGVITLVKAPAGNDGEQVTGVVSVEGVQGSPYFGGAGRDAGVNGTNGSRDITATEGTGSFTSGALTIGSKVPQALKDVPQSISVLTSERLEQQNVTDFTGAMRQLPGVTLAQGATSLENTFYSRGFAITSIQVDGGAPLTTSFAGSDGVGYFPQIDMSIYDHVELLRGAAGLFNGYGDPSGTVNLVRKKPLDHSQVSIEAQAGSWQNYRIVADATSPLAFGGKLRGRLVMTYQDNHYFYDTANDNKTLIYGVAELDASPTTLITAGVNYTKQNSLPWSGGLPRYQTGADLELPRSTCLCFDWNHWRFDTTEIFGGAEQTLGDDWTAKLNLTWNRQQSTRKIGYSSGAVNPSTGAGPRLLGNYADYASKQFSAEGTLSGAFELFGQRQEITFGANRVSSDAGGLTGYSSLITGTAANPYQPYPGGPLFCTNASICQAGVASPPIDVFDFNQSDPNYTEPRNSVASNYYPSYGTVQSGAYVSLKLTAFDRLHLLTGLRWGRYQYNYVSQFLCTSAGGSCQNIGDVSFTDGSSYRDDDFSWPPPLNLSFDVTKQLSAYVGYTDIYVSQSTYLNIDEAPIAPITGSNWEAGLKWAARNGRLNVSLSAYRIKQKGFATADGYTDNDTGDFVASNGVHYPDFGTVDPVHSCCYKSDPNHTLKSKGFDIDITGEILPGWQVSANYTYNENEQAGSYFDSSEGEPLVSIQPKHLYKLWISYDFGVAIHGGALSGLTLSGGVNGQSSAYRQGTVCKEDFIVTNATTGVASCPSKVVDGENVPGSYRYSFTVPAYAVVSGRIDYRISKIWSLAVNIENIFDKTYYQTVGSAPTNGNWYGAPRSYTATLRAKW
ncbi:MAG: TonB-dependent receptor [Candidatus Andeanibacterium colombiense]|uniref:TonB-dependent receptor n=1 Tax=Candidatus Andeanibacterium colombiense TaxID=3121345 RepID=A0AAJ5X3I7_9SPHN|nr:MAG: TonB-dependent receptor [Sphingomonadaceae bacterium]